MLKRFQDRSEEREWLDEPPIPKKELEKNLRDLERINRLLGGHRATILGIRELLPGDRSSCSVIDVGCGGGDTLHALDRFASKRGIELEMTGVDPLPEALNFAREHWSGQRSPEWRERSFEALSEEECYDISTTSLFCHHLYGSQLHALLQKLYRISRYGVVINDLHRHPLAYYGIRFLSTLLSDSAYLKNDAPLSVLKGFRREEWESILDRTGLPDPKVRWVWAFRHCIVIPKTEGYGP